MKTYTMQTTTFLSRVTVELVVFGLVLTAQAQAGGWFSYADNNFALNIGGSPWGWFAPAPVVVNHPVQPIWRPGRYVSRFNPVVERREGLFVEPGRRGTTHTEYVTEDYHASYFNPGRDVAVTAPQTSVIQQNGRNWQQTMEHTSWIGADRQPHSETITTTTTRDRWGNTHTDTAVTAKSAPNETQPVAAAGETGTGRQR